MTEVADPTVFVSHGAHSREVADALSEYLGDHGWTISLPRDQTFQARSWQSAVEDAIEAADAVVLLIESEPSDAVRFEWSIALRAKWEEEGKRVVPVLLLGAEAPSFLRDLPAVRLSDDVDEQGFSEVLTLINSQSADQEQAAAEGEQSRLAGRLDQAIEALKSDAPDRGELESHREWLAGELAGASLEADAQRVTVVALSLGLIEAELGDAAGARGHLEDSLRVLKSEKQPDLERVMTVLMPLGDIQQELEDFEAAIRSYQEVLAIQESEGDSSPAVAATLEKIGVALLRAGRPSEAQSYLERSLTISRDQLGALHPRVSALELWLGLAAEAAGDHETAKRVYEQALQDSPEPESDDDRVPQVMRLWGLGGALSKLEDFEAAREFLRRSLDVAEEQPRIGPKVRASIYFDLGNTERSRGNLDSACELFERALQLFEEAESRNRLATTHLSLGMALQEKKDLEGARKAVSAGLREAEQEFGATDPLVVNALSLLGVIALDEGDLDQAEKRIRQAIGIESKCETPDAKRLRDLNRALDRITETRSTAAAS